MEQDGSRSTRQRREDIRGKWWHPGQGEAILELCHDGQVIYEKDDGRTEKQGQWQMYTTRQGANVLEVTFHHKGTDAVALLRQHLLYELCPGLWRAQDHKQIFLVEEMFDGSLGLWREGLERLRKPPDLEAVGKHYYAWLHPGRHPALLVLTHEGQIIFVDRNAEPEKAPGPANGYYEYGHNVEGVEQWFTHFHCAGGEKKVTTRLLRCSVAPIWRAFGDGTRDYDTSHNYLAEWHIVMFQMA